MSPTSPRPRRLAGAAVVIASLVLLVGCVLQPQLTPADPQLPDTTSNPAFPNPTDPPTTAGPSTPPVPTTPPGQFTLGDTITIHTTQGTTWEITPTQSIDPADDRVRAEGYEPRQGSRAVALELTVKNVGVVATHPYYDIAFAYQPNNGPRYDQNTGSLIATADDIGYTPVLQPGDSVTGTTLVQVPENADTGVWIIGDGVSEYRFG